MFKVTQELKDCVEKWSLNLKTTKKKPQQNPKLSSKFPQKLFDLIKKNQSVKPLKILDSILKGS